MLKGIPSNVSSALLKALADMGHGDTIVIADHFYPAATMGAGGIVIDAKGNGTLDMLLSLIHISPGRSWRDTEPNHCGAGGQRLRH